MHPLNRPHLDPEVNRVTEGYGILQPRVSMSLATSSRSDFSRIFSGHTGVDPYTTAVSDIYQDLFGEGSYTGKGLYDVDAFEAALAGRVPENLLLSHDLFESLYARAALVTDIELLDDYPSHYDSYAKRQARWTRGDWQIARWLLPRVRDGLNRPVRNRLPMISRWKIFDVSTQSCGSNIVFVAGSHLTVLPGHHGYGWLPSVIRAFPFTRTSQMRWSPPARHPVEQSLLERLGRYPNQHRTVLAFDCIHSASDDFAELCNNAHSLSKAHFKEEAARVGYRRRSREGERA
jgi:cyclic beta-1,2-glucan synthetase